MILKRRNVRAADIGGLAKIKHKVRSKMMDIGDYEDQSASYHVQMLMKKIGNGNLIQSLDYHNKVLLADAPLVYILDEPQIFKGISRVIPLAIDSDNSNGIAVRRILDKKQSFFMRMSSLDHCGTEDALLVMSMYRDTISNYIANCIKGEGRYNNPRFSWAGK